MAAAVITVTRPSDVRGCVIGNKRMSFRDITANTGDYAAGGFTLTAAQLVSSAKHIDFVSVGSMATDGTSGATCEVVGINYLSSGTSVQFQVYQTGTSADAPMNEKGAEAYAANFTFRVMIIHT
jgi:hypothetical protein